MLAPLAARQLNNAAVRCQAPAQDRQSSVRLDGVVCRPHDPLSGALSRGLRDLGHGASVYIADMPVQQSCCEEVAGYQWETAGPMQVDCLVGPSGRNVGDDWSARRDCIEVIDGEGDAEFIRDRQAVQDCVG